MNSSDLTTLIATFTFSAIYWCVRMKALGLTVFVVTVFVPEFKAAKMNECKMESLDGGIIK